jgi:uncharacterized protein YciI
MAPSLYPTGVASRREAHYASRMFVIVLTYRAELAQIDAALAEHVAWLDEQYAAGVFLASGRRVPRVGGVILARGLSREALQQRIEQDPFHQRGLADYEVVEFVPSRAAPGLEGLLPRSA